MKPPACIPEFLSYDSDTGIFTWRVSRSWAAKAGSAAGTVHKAGYTRILFEGRSYAAHRLAWFFVHGVWPSGHIDHKNGDRNDNRISNLRDVTAAVNAQNQWKPRKTNKTGFLGVSPWFDKYLATITAHGKKHSLGVHATPEQAHAAYL